MRASLLIAAHNEGEALWKTIRSCVEASAGLDHEIIVADDASTDGSVEETRRRFPQVRLVSFPERRGASPTKHLAGENARGEVLVFLDGHTNPEGTALLRLVEDVEALNGDAIVTPALPHLDPVRWLNSRSQIGHGYTFRLDTLDCGWVPLNRMTPRDVARRRLYESPALIGCALAIGRGLYQELWGFDAAMRSWGVEDIDFGLKAWLLGYPILHDPQAIVGHRFRQAFDNYDVPPADLLANQLRFARKHFTSAVWAQWVEACRVRNQGPLPGHPEGLWARAWSVFKEGRDSIEQERQYLHSRRTRDEFEYAATFDLEWPKLAGEGGQSTAVSVEGHAAVAQFSQLQPSPSPSPPPPPCTLTAIDPDRAVVCVNYEKTFAAVGTNVDDVEWASIGATPPTGKGPTYRAKWADPTLEVLVGARCKPGETGVRAKVTVLSLSFNKNPIRTGFERDGESIVPLIQPCVLTVEPPEAADRITLVPAWKPPLPPGQQKPERVEITIVETDPEAGRIFFFVGGKSMTPKNEPLGDTVVRALFDGMPIEGDCSEVPAIVIVPFSLKPDYPTASGTAITQNIAGNNTTTPAFPSIRDPKVWLLTIYYHILNIPVYDQFGHSLDPIYDGVHVSERFDGSLMRFAINRTIQDGTYQDPVGLFGYGTAREVVDKNSQRALDWPTSSERKSLPIPPYNRNVQEIFVQVGGHVIRSKPDGDPPAITNRTVVGSGTDQIQITWPAPPGS